MRGTNQASLHLGDLGTLELSSNQFSYGRPEAISELMTYSSITVLRRFLIRHYSQFALLARYFEQSKVQASSYNSGATLFMKTTLNTGTP